MLDHEFLHGGTREGDGDEDGGHGECETPFLSEGH